MIPASARLDVLWLDPADVVSDPPQPMNLGQIEFYVSVYADQGEDHVAPPIVNAPDERGRYTLRDGHHRWAAHLVLGRKRIRCLVVKPAPDVPF